MATRQRRGSRGRNSFTGWKTIRTNVPAAAYTSVDGQRIMNTLQIKLGDRGYRNCQACHEPYANKMLTSLASGVGEAVGCEACHGPSKHWVADHYKPHWRWLSVSEKRQRGMKDTLNLVARARMCARCHVGGAGREVNHDMIAAGHPPLKFEMASYHEMLPKHWDAQGERRRDPDFEIRLWAFGQLAAAEAALDVLATRALYASRPPADASSHEDELPRPGLGGDSERFPHHTWPELAEYSCFSCHQDLAQSSWRRDRKYTGAVGMAPWRSWYFALPLNATAAGAGSELGY